MLKGAQKRMIVVKTADSRLFEEAYFVMRADASPSGEDMVYEANKIIENCGGKRRERTRRAATEMLLPICTFIGGSMLGSGVMLLLTMIAG